MIQGEYTLTLTSPIDRDDEHGNKAGVRELVHTELLAPECIMNDPHLGPISNDVSPPYMGTLCVHDHRPGRTNSNNTQPAARSLTSQPPSLLIPNLPLGPTSAVATTEPHVTSSPTFSISDLYLGHLPLQLQMMD
jgi:hypothetical protein